MRFPTIPEMEDRAECFMFGHDWHRARRADGTSIRRCSTCGAEQER